jgi:NhaP-type Na+/H+ or K+/H+ antiporter
VDGLATERNRVVFLNSCGSVRRSARSPFPSVLERLRYLLNVESGLNDGLALPAVVALLEVVSSGQPHYADL